ncbi:MAG: hypothetical protein RLZZ336_1864, partial [Cyanobacteriota bacterium]
VTAPHQAQLLQLAQVAIHRGQAHRPAALAQAGMQVLTRQLTLAALELLEELLLFGGERHGRTASESFYPTWTALGLTVGARAPDAPACAGDAGPGSWHP